MVMWSAFRTTFLCLRTATASFSPNSSTTVIRRTTRCSHFFTSLAGFDSFPAVEKQFNEFYHRLDKYDSIRDRITDAAYDIESARWKVHSRIRRDLRSRPIPEILEDAKSQIGVLKQLFGGLALIVTPGQYYRYHGGWREEAQHSVSLLGFMRWLETGGLLLHSEVEEILGLNALEFGLDEEDYLIGLCFMSNELATYVVDHVAASDYDCLSKVLKFLTNLNLKFYRFGSKSEFLCTKLDGMEADLNKVQEAYYYAKIQELTSKADYYVKIQELTSKGDSKEDQT